MKFRSKKDRYKGARRLCCQGLCLTHKPLLLTEWNTQSSIGVSERQIQIIAQAIPKAQYYYQSRSGNRLFELALSPFALAVAGSSSRDDLNLMDKIIASHPQDFAARFLASKGLSRKAKEKTYEAA